MKKIILIILLIIGFQVSALSDEMSKSIATGNITKVEKLINNGIDINNFTNSTPYLHIAAYYNQSDIVNLLIKKGVNINLTDSKGNTALQYACAKKNIDIINILIDNNIDLSIKDIHGNTVLDNALDSGDKDIIALLKKGTHSKPKKYKKSQTIVNNGSVTWNSKNNGYMTYFDGKFWFNPNKRLTHLKATKYCKNVSLNNVNNFRLATLKELQRYRHNIKKISYYWASGEYDWGAQYINNYGNGLTSRVNNKFSTLCVRNPGYKNKIFTLAQLMYSNYIKNKSKLILPKKPIKPKYKNLIKDEFEPTKKFKIRKDKMKQEIDAKYTSDLNIWKNKILKRKKAYKQTLASMEKNKNKIYYKFIEEAIKVKYGKAQISNVKYDADKEEFKFRLKSSSFNYKKINMNRLVKKRSTKTGVATLVKVYDKDESTTILKFIVNKKLTYFNPSVVLNSTYAAPKYVIFKNKILYNKAIKALKRKDIQPGSIIEFAVPYISKNSFTLLAIFEWTNKVKNILIKKGNIKKQYLFDKVVTIPVSLKYAKKFKAILTDKNFKPTIEFQIKNNKLVFSGIKEIKDPEVLVEESEYKKAYNIKNNKSSLSALQQFIDKYPNSTFRSSAKSRISILKEKIKVQKEKDRLAKIKREKENRIREEKIAKAKKRKQDSYYAKKYVGDKVCKDGITAIILSITITAYVERVNGDAIQLRIADTEGTTPNMNGVTLYKNTLIWEDYRSWYKCNY
jgi:hypothetical protein